MNPKVYVQVEVEFREDGCMRPRAILWEDGRRFEIEKITDVRQAAAKRADGQGERYTIYVNGQQSYLFFERTPRLTGNRIGRWFVERRTA